MIGGCKPIPQKSISPGREEMINSFEDLEIWQRGHALTLKIYKTTRAFPREEQYGLISQIRRSSSSVCANIAEGHRKTTKEFIRYLDITVASLEETKYHLILSRDLNYFSVEVFKSLFEEACRVSKMVTSLNRKLRDKIY